MVRGQGRPVQMWFAPSRGVLGSFQCVAAFINMQGPDSHTPWHTNRPNQPFCIEMHQQDDHRLGVLPNQFLKKTSLPRCGDPMASRGRLVRLSFEALVRRRRPLPRAPLRLTGSLRSPAEAASTPPMPGEGSRSARRAQTPHPPTNAVRNEEARPEGLSLGRASSVSRPVGR